MNFKHCNFKSLQKNVFPKSIIKARHQFGIMICSKHPVLCLVHTLNAQCLYRAFQVRYIVSFTLASEGGGANACATLPPPPHIVWKGHRYFSCFELHSPAKCLLYWFAFWYPLPVSCCCGVSCPQQTHNHLTPEIFQVNILLWTKGGRSSVLLSPHHRWLRNRSVSSSSTVSTVSHLCRTCRLSSTHPSGR